MVASMLNCWSGLTCNDVCRLPGLETLWPWEVWRTSSQERPCVTTGTQSCWSVWSSLTLSSRSANWYSVHSRLKEPIWQCFGRLNPNILEHDEFLENTVSLTLCMIMQSHFVWYGHAMPYSTVQQPLKCLCVDVWVWLLWVCFIWGQYSFMHALWWL